MTQDIIQTFQALQTYVDEFERILREFKQSDRNRDFYHAMERLLRNYPKMCALVEDAEDYLTLREHDHSVSIAPQPGGVPKDEYERREERAEAKRQSYAETMTQFRRVDSVIRQFESQPEFIVIRMYYFGEDAFGNPREDTRPRSFEEISEELEAAGIHRSERTLRQWRTKLVQDMVVVMFGVDGALSLAAPRNKSQAQS